MKLRQKFKAFLMRRQKDLTTINPIGVGMADMVVNRKEYKELDKEEKKENDFKKMNWKTIKELKGTVEATKENEEDEEE